MNQYLIKQSRVYRSSELNRSTFVSLGDALLDDLFKQTGWKNKTDAQVNVTYPADGKNTKNVTYVTMIVYQVKYFKIFFFSIQWKAKKKCNYFLLIGQYSDGFRYRDLT